MKELLGVPDGASVGFVTGAQAANTVGLAAARHHVLAEAGWDVERRGLLGAPAVRVLAGAGAARHRRPVAAAARVSAPTCIEPVRADAERRDRRPATWKRVLAQGEPGRPLIVCLQAGNVNTGACDDLRAACELVHARGGWVHVDGAFGLWAAASPRTRHLVDGVELADSWGCDAHKWLNVPYDSAFAIVLPAATCTRPRCRTPPSYLVGSGRRPGRCGLHRRVLPAGPRASRSGRRSASSARNGVADLVDRCCALARRFADALAAPASRSPTTSCSTRCWSASATTSAPTR